MLPTLVHRCRLPAKLADVTSIGADAEVDPREVGVAPDGPARIWQAVEGLYQSGKPVVAGISGHALGGAFVLALACDIRLAAQGPFKLGLTEAEAGIPFPAGPLTVVRAELSPAQVRVLALGSLVAQPASGVFAGIIDRVLEPSALVDTGIQEARRLAALPAFGRVKQQLRAVTVERLAQIVERDDEPLLNGWV